MYEIIILRYVTSSTCHFQEYPEFGHSHGLCKKLGLVGHAIVHYIVWCVLARLCEREERQGTGRGAAQSAIHVRRDKRGERLCVEEETGQTPDGTAGWTGAKQLTGAFRARVASSHQSNIVKLREVPEETRLKQSDMVSISTHLLHS